MTCYTVLEGPCGFEAVRQGAKNEREFFPTVDAGIEWCRTMARLKGEAGVVKVMRRISPGEIALVEMPHSEVMMHMQVAGQTMRVQLLEHKATGGSAYSCQLFRDGKPFSFPTTTGEAGLFRDKDGFYFYQKLELPQPEPAVA